MKKRRSTGGIFVEFRFGRLEGRRWDSSLPCLYRALGFCVVGCSLIVANNLRNEAQRGHMMRNGWLKRYCATFEQTYSAHIRDRDQIGQYNNQNSSNRNKIKSLTVRQ